MICVTATFASPTLVHTSHTPIPFQPHPDLTATSADILSEQLRRTNEAIINLQRQHNSFVQSFRLDHGVRAAVSPIIPLAQGLVSVPQHPPALTANEAVVTNIPQADVVEQIINLELAV